MYSYNFYLPFKTFLSFSYIEDLIVTLFIFCPFRPLPWYLFRLICLLCFSLLSYLKFISSLVSTFTRFEWSIFYFYFLPRHHHPPLGRYRLCILCLFPTFLCTRKRSPSNINTVCVENRDECKGGKRPLKYDFVPNTI